MFAMLLLVPAAIESERNGGSGWLLLLLSLGIAACCHWLLKSYEQRYGALYVVARRALEEGGILLLTLDRQLPELEPPLLGLFGGRQRNASLQRESLAARLGGLPAAFPALCEELRLRARDSETQRQRLHSGLGLAALAFLNLLVYCFAGPYQLTTFGAAALIVLDLILLQLPLRMLRFIETGAVQHALHDCLQGREASARAAVHGYAAQS